MNEKTKKLNLYKTLGAELTKQGRWFLKKAFNVKITKTISMGELLAFTDSIGIARNKIFCADRKYVIVDIATMKDLIKYDWGDKRKYIVALGDCFLPTSPLVIKKDDKIDVVSIDTLPEKPENTFVLDIDIETKEMRWTKINWVKSKFSNKDIVTTNGKGFLQTTSDHKFYQDNEWKEIKDISPDNNGLISTEKISFLNEKDFDPELAYAFGIFVAEGTSKTYQTSTTKFGHSWHIDMGEKDILERIKPILEKYAGVKLKIVLYDSQKAGSVRGGCVATQDMYRLKTNGKYGNGKILVEKFVNKFYDNKWRKKIPQDILDADKKSKKQFIQGFLDGDGHSELPNVYRAASKSRAVYLGLKILAEQVGYTTTSGYDNRTYGNRSDYPVITIRKREKVGSGLPRHKIYRQNMGENLVYDVNTESGHLFAGGYLVHNCDDYSNEFKANISQTYRINSVALARSFQVKIGSRIVWHRCCMFLATDKGKLKAYLLETQNDNLHEITEQKDIQMGKWTYLLGKHEHYDF